MASFRYRLEPLLDKKIGLKDAAQRALADRIVEQRDAEQELVRLEQEERKMTREHAELRRGVMVPGPDGVLDSIEIEQRSEYVKVHEAQLEDARNAVFSQRIAVENAVDAVAAARAHLAEASREVEVLNKHREKSLARFMKELERQEALEQDEIGSMLHSARKHQ